MKTVETRLAEKSFTELESLQQQLWKQIDKMEEGLVPFNQQRWDILVKLGEHIFDAATKINERHKLLSPPIEAFPIILEVI